MSEKVTFNSEDPNETESKKGRKEKASDKDARKLIVPLPIERSDKAEAKPERDSLRQPPKSFLDKIIGHNTEKPEVKPASDSAEVNINETDLGNTASEEALAEDANVEEVIIEQAEQSVAEDLHGGEEISLREIAQVPPQRDEHIIAEALDMDTHTEAVPEVNIAEELPSAVVNEVPSVELEISPVAETIAPEERSVEQPVITVTPPIPFRRPQYQPRSYRSRPGGTGFIPPMPPVGGGNVPPAGGEYNPNFASFTPGYGPENIPNTVPTTANIRKTVEDAEWDGRQQGRREGVFAGLLVGGGIEHFRHKRREKKMEKRQKKEILSQQKRVERLEYDYETAKQRQKTEQVHSEANFINERLATTVERAKHEKELEELKKNQERLIQQTTEVKQPQEELLAVLPKDHHIESSAWHNIEVDKHGNAVQESAIEYGHEYYKERTHEVVPQQQIDSAAGEVALVAAALSESESNRPTYTTPTLAPVAITKVGAASAQNSAQKVFKTITTPPSSPFATVVWLAVLLVIAAIIFAVVR